MAEKRVAVDVEAADSGNDAVMPSGRKWHRSHALGKVEIHLEEIARQRGYVLENGAHKGKVNLTTLMHGTGISYTTLWDYLRRPEKVRGMSFDTLVTLCAFLKCQPGDLFTVSLTGQHSGGEVPAGPEAGYLEIEQDGSQTSW